MSVTKEQLCKWVAANDHAQCELDEMVHESKSYEASEINNRGVYDQLDYLIGGDTNVDYVIKQLNWAKYVQDIEKFTTESLLASAEQLARISGKKYAVYQLRDNGEYRIGRLADAGYHAIGRLVCMTTNGNLE